jgi:hypothetical protein
MRCWLSSSSIATASRLRLPSSVTLEIAWVSNCVFAVLRVSRSLIPMTVRLGSASAKPVEEKNNNNDDDNNNSSSSSNNNLEIYQHAFEKPFIAATDVYYAGEMTTFLHENGVSEYLKKAEKRIAEEMDRLAKCLHASSAAPLNSKLDEVFVAQHLATLHAKIDTFLLEDQRDDLKRLCHLLARCGKLGLEPLQARLPASMCDCEQIVGDVGGAGEVHRGDGPQRAHRRGRRRRHQPGGVRRHTAACVPSLPRAHQRGDE